jgi:hypothetical protein
LEVNKFSLVPASPRYAFVEYALERCTLCKAEDPY